MDLALFRSHKIHQQKTALDKILHIEPERSNVLRQFLLILLERHEEARLCEFGCPSYKKFHAEERFAATSSTGDQSRTPTRQTASCDFVEAVDAGWRLREAREFTILAIMFRHRHISSFQVVHAKD